MAKGTVNKVIIIGRLGADPEMRYMPDGMAIANLRVATNEVRKDRNTGENQEQTEWHRIVAFGKLGEIIGQYLRKGSRAYFEGRIQTKKWQDQSGQDRYSTDILANEMQMLDSRSDASASYAQAPPASSQAPSSQPTRGQQPTNYNGGQQSQPARPAPQVPEQVETAPRQPQPPIPQPAAPATDYEQAEAASRHTQPPAPLPVRPTLQTPQHLEQLDDKPFSHQAVQNPEVAENYAAADNSQPFSPAPVASVPQKNTAAPPIPPLGDEFNDILPF